MKVRKWLMKQQWRIVQIRGIWGLFYGILLLAIAYFEYIPFFVDLSIFGPFAFAGLLLFVFLILGYLYDRVFVMWAPSQEVNMERNPYQYVPSPKDHIFWLPLYNSMLEITKTLANEYDVDTQAIEDAKEYYSKLQQLRPERKEDLEKSEELRDDFLATHSFMNKNS